jgi:hypothetical protein
LNVAYAVAVSAAEINSLNSSGSYARDIVSGDKLRRADDEIVFARTSGSPDGNATLYDVAPLTAFDPTAVIRLAGIK